MATTNYWLGTWVSGTGDPPLLAGQSKSFIMWSFGYGDAITVTAHPLRFYSPAILKVTDVRLEDSDTGRRLYFTVENVGPNYVHAFAIGYSMISA